jgi:transposase InsO family protein
LQGRPIGSSSRYAKCCRSPHQATGATLPINAIRRAKLVYVLLPHIERVWQANKRLYGADKVWMEMNREGVCIARCTLERLMRRLGLQGMRCGMVVRTTVSDIKAP